MEILTSTDAHTSSNMGTAEARRDDASARNKLEHDSPLIIGDLYPPVDQAISETALVASEPNEEQSPGVNQRVSQSRQNYTIGKGRTASSRKRLKSPIGIKLKQEQNLTQNEKEKKSKFEEEEYDDLHALFNGTEKQVLYRVNMLIQQHDGTANTQTAENDLLHYAVDKNFVTVAEKIIEHNDGATILHLAENQCSPLHYALGLERKQEDRTRTETKKKKRARKKLHYAFCCEKRKQGHKTVKETDKNKSSRKKDEMAALLISKLKPYEVRAIFGDYTDFRQFFRNEHYDVQASDSPDDSDTSVVQTNTEGINPASHGGPSQSKNRNDTQIGKEADKLKPFFNFMDILEDKDLKETAITILDKLEDIDPETNDPYVYLNLLSGNQTTKKSKHNRVAVNELTKDVEIKQSTIKSEGNIGPAKEFEKDDENKQSTEMSEENTGEGNELEKIEETKQKSEENTGLANEVKMYENKQSTQKSEENTASANEEGNEDMKIQSSQKCEENTGSADEVNKGDKKKKSKRIKCAFHYIVKHRPALTNHPACRALIEHKWNKWAFRSYLFDTILYFLSFIALTVCTVVGAQSDGVFIYDSNWQYTRLSLEILMCLFIFRVVFIECIQFILDPKDYVKSVLNCIELGSAILLIVEIGLRAVDHNAHWFVFAVGYVLWTVKGLKYAAITSHTAAYSETLRVIMIRDFWLFALFFIAIEMVFGGTYLLVLKGTNSLNISEDTTTILGIYYVGLRTMIEGGFPVEDYDTFPKIAQAVIIVFSALTIVVMLNILIAQLSNTYQKAYAEGQIKSWINRADAIVNFEMEDNLKEKFICRTGILSFLCFRTRTTSGQMEKLKFNKETLLEEKEKVDEMRSSLKQLDNKLIHTDLTIQTIKTRVNKLLQTVPGVPATGKGNAKQPRDRHGEIQSQKDVVIKAIEDLTNLVTKMTDSDKNQLNIKD